MGKAVEVSNSPFLKKLCVFSTIKMDVLKYNLDYPDSLLIRLILMRTESGKCNVKNVNEHVFFGRTFSNSLQLPYTDSTGTVHITRDKKKTIVYHR